MEFDEDFEESITDYKQDSESNTSMWLPISRKLTFSPVPDDVNFLSSITSTSSPIKLSPPCRNFLTLRLTEQPTTPGTIYLNSGRRIPVSNKLNTRLSAPNLNPFTPESMLKLSKKRSRCSQSR